MKFAIVSDNIVSNIVLAEQSFAEEQGWVQIPESLAVSIGWNYDGSIFSEPSSLQAKYEKIDWDLVREQRNRLLVESDQYMLVDRFNSLSSEKQNLWSEYRQKLRDLPQDYIEAESITWPNRPGIDDTPLEFR